MIDLEDLDTDEHMYILRRVSKQKLKEEAKGKVKAKQERFESRF